MPMWWNGACQGTGMGGWMLFPGILFLLLLLLGIAALVAVIRSISRGGVRRTDDSGRSPAHAILEERYARGDLEREEYLQKKSDLGA